MPAWKKASERAAWIYNRLDFELNVFSLLCPISAKNILIFHKKKIKKNTVHKSGAVHEMKSHFVICQNEKATKNKYWGTAYIYKHISLKLGWWEPRL